MFPICRQGAGLRFHRLFCLLLLAMPGALQPARVQDKLEEETIIRMPHAADATTPTLEVRSYKIAQQDGPRLKALLERFLHADAPTSPSLRRRIFFLNDDLFICDTTENHEKIEDMSFDPVFTNLLHGEAREVIRFNLAPSGYFPITDPIRIFSARCVEMIKVMLYSLKGETGANAEDRWIRYDPYTLDLTVADDPINMARVRRFMEALNIKPLEPLNLSSPDNPHQ